MLWREMFIYSLSFASDSNKESAVIYISKHIIFLESFENKYAERLMINEHVMRSVHRNIASFLKIFKEKWEKERNGETIKEKNV